MNFDNVGPKMISFFSGVLNGTKEEMAKNTLGSWGYNLFQYRSLSLTAWNPPKMGEWLEEDEFLPFAAELSDLLAVNCSKLRGVIW